MRFGQKLQDIHTYVTTCINWSSLVKVVLNRGDVCHGLYVNGFWEYRIKKCNIYFPSSYVLENFSLQEVFEAIYADRLI